ncbi:Esl2p KNAG_0C06630 [Huiozyma naganishii CBS 8797]|uniref:PIN domain-containing protein n=1 Tax=Huiozyma naganishii (strain ATCC MYA-139 / BCRC 22969 / CBS 8797 / KCTC 17520 / NBRC 10181 / NCYC 3082 / Yp74L-3) TaxID=1071383 RepID=J7R4H9_HUIN7|nr:hypothetical protein KNAG_0C06630 [Kazachstania naganishii CBS 8797]CCK69755.1 hypothetical protein KNAG_0C06630 [Kazachstania naganishii CBS 8797]
MPQLLAAQLIPNNSTGNNNNSNSNVRNNGSASGFVHQQNNSVIFPRDSKKTLDGISCIIASVEKEMEAHCQGDDGANHSGQKRHGSASYSFANANFPSKRRIANAEEDSKRISSYSDNLLLQQNTPRRSRDVARKSASGSASGCRSASGSGSAPQESPFCMEFTSLANVDPLPTTGGAATGVNTPGGLGVDNISSGKQTVFIDKSIGATHRYATETQQGEIDNNGEGEVAGNNDNADNDGLPTNGNGDNNEKNLSNDNDNSNNNSNNNNNYPADQSDAQNTSVTRKSSQALVQKLQDIYKVIVKQEIELQERCSQLTTSQTTELKNLWTIYKINTDLINNYTTFITTALLPSQPAQDILIGEEIVEIYRIERRLWVYGTITFLDVLKNFSNFMDPEVCSQFITHVFISLSAILIDIPPKHAIPWLQRLGDLSRMAIALYPSGFIDWKLSAEHWYMEAMKFTYSHGKLYYHMSTVQQNTLEAFVNLGKSVFCQDTFTPSQQYMQLVIDNIYQRTFVDRNTGGNYRNPDLIDYLKHSEVMLLPSFLGSKDLQQVVLNYFQDRFGIDYSENNIFDTQDMFFQPPSCLRFFFRHAPAFAESHILQLVGFGNPKNPFALLFELPKYLKERRDKKEKNKSKSTSTADVSSTAPKTVDDQATDNVNEGTNDDHELTATLSGPEYLDNIETLKYAIETPDICTWIKSLDFINMTSLKCSMIVLKKFLHGPLLIALPHFLPWTVFIIACGIKVNELENEKNYKFWRILMKRIFPWDTITSFLNVLLAYVLDNYGNTTIIEELCMQYSDMDLDDMLAHFNKSEDLPEVWKCWGTLWYDAICNKNSVDADTFAGFGIGDHMFLDFPIDGIEFDAEDETGAKFWKRALRVIFLFKGISKKFDFGLKISHEAGVYCRNEKAADSPLRRFTFKLESYDEPTSSKFNEFIPLCEEVSAINNDALATPSLSVVQGENIFEYMGYRTLGLDKNSFDKNGEIVSSSIYTSWMIDTGEAAAAASSATDNNAVSEGQGDLAANGTPISASLSAAGKTTTSHVTDDQDPGLNENDLFKKFMSLGDPRDRNVYHNMITGKSYLVKNLWESSVDELDRLKTFFIFDATSWLRHFAHIYKIATNGVLKFGVCLTTFQELRFLRKSKDENVVEAAARAIITMRQLYRENRLLPLRFTGNVANDIEEHLEFEEQITWRSHVDEFVIEAVMKAQDKFTTAGETKQPEEEGTGPPRVPLGGKRFHYVTLVTNDQNMKRKAQDQGIKTFSTDFVFSLCSKLGMSLDLCTN